MRAVVIDEFTAQPEVREVPRPAAPPGGAVIEVRATGLCRSDWHAWAGHDGDVTPPFIPGHEFAGVIAELGEGVSGWQVGDRVTMPFIEGCGVCTWCERGDAQVCPDQQQPGFTHDGSFAEQVAVHAAQTNLVRIPDGVSFKAAAALGCRFATAFRALTARARIQAGESVVIVGAGGVGLSATMIANALGARPVVVDRNPRALEAAARLGAAHTILSVEGADVPAGVEGFLGEGADVSIDAVGSPATARDAVLSLRRRGRHVQVGLLPSADGLTGVPMARVIAWELDLLGSHGMAAADYPAMLELIARGALRPQKLIEKTIGLAEAARTLPGFDTADVAGVTIVEPHREAPITLGTLTGRLAYDDAAFDDEDPQLTALFDGKES